MSLTINGATNTLTAASGLTIAGNTAVTGTLSATGVTDASRFKPTGAPSASEAGLSLYSSGFWLNTPSGTIGYLGVNGSGVAAVSSTGLAVTGSATVGTGAASTFGNLILNGAAQANHGSYITFQRNSATVGYVGQRASIIGSGSNADDMAYFAGAGLGQYWYVNGSTTSSMSLDTTALTLGSGVKLLPTTDNTQDIGAAATGFKEIFADNGTINTSDARRKTEVSALSAAEINAAKQLAKEIGSFKFLSAVAEKGDAARLHIGMTVQRAIEIMEGNGLDPFAYSFICHDVWQDVFVEHPAVEAVAAQDAVLDEDGNVVTPAVAAVEGREAWTEQTQAAGDKYSFRVHELLLFMAAGFEARLAALEAA